MPTRDTCQKLEPGDVRRAIPRVIASVFHIIILKVILPNTKLPTNEELSLIMAPSINTFIFLSLFTLEDRKSVV